MTGISVVIPCHNAGRWIGQAIGSALRQTLPPREVIVVDDRSTDDSAAVAEAFGPPVRVVRTDHGNGASARSDGAAAASGDGLLFLDADDLLGPEALEGLAEALPEGGIARCDWRRYEEAAEDVWIARLASCQPLAPGQDALAGWLTGWYCPPAAILWSRDALERSGGWCRGRYCNQDGDVVMRALARGAPMERAPFGEVFYRRLTAATVSDRRLNREGVSARLDVLDEVRDVLEAEGRAEPYRHALAEAYEDVRKDAAAGGFAGEEQRAARFAQARAAQALLRRARGRLTLRRERAPLQQGRPLRHRASKPFGPQTLVSVVVPTFERPEATVRAVRSILAQSHERLEVLVVDDASGDDTPDRVGAMADPRLRLIRQEANGGVARARNRGMAEATGELIAFLDSDDEWLPEKTERSLEALSLAGEGAGLVTCGTRTLRPGDDPEDRPALTAGWAFEPLLVANPLHGAPSSAIITRAVYETIGGFDPSLPAIEDWDYWIRAARFFSFAATAEPLAVYHEADDAGRRSRQFRANMVARNMLYRRYRDELRRTGQAQGFLMRSARRELTEAGGRAAEGQRLVLAALAEGPLNPRLYPWLPYMMMPGRARATLRKIDGREEPRPV